MTHPKIKNRTPMFIINVSEANEADIRYLYKEQSLVSQDIDILFICIDDYDQRYLVTDLDWNSNEYTVCPISDYSLVELLHGRETLLSPYYQADKIYHIITDYLPEQDIVKIYGYNNCPKELLPDYNARLCISEHKAIKDYLKRLYDYYQPMNWTLLQA